MSVLTRLREIYYQQLSVAPFPNEECAIAGISGALHGNMILYLADIAGIASRGEELLRLEQATTQSYRVTIETGFWEKYPECQSRITAVTTPNLYRLISATEEARLLIKGVLTAAD